MGGSLGVIHLNTIPHTGTHFIRFLLELHPTINFWLGQLQRVDEQSLMNWHLYCKYGIISEDELFRKMNDHHERHVPWTLKIAEKFSFAIPEKIANPVLFFHTHLINAEATWFWYSEPKTIVTMRDPLLTIISHLRTFRNAPFIARVVIQSYIHLFREALDRCFVFCIDLFERDKSRAYELFQFLKIDPTLDMQTYIDLWPRLNFTRAGDNRELIDAKLLLQRKNKIHSVLKPWAKQLQEFNLQPMFEKLGYTDLAWFN